VRGGRWGGGKIDKFVHGNIERAYDALWAEHQRIHRIHVKTLAQGDDKLERRLMRGKMEDGKYQDELLDYEERLPRSEQRRGAQTDPLRREDRKLDGCAGAVEVRRGLWANGK
jgi:hypothetical protein